MKMTIHHSTAYLSITDPKLVIHKMLHIQHIPHLAHQLHSTPDPVHTTQDQIQPDKPHKRPGMNLPGVFVDGHSQQIARFVWLMGQQAIIMESLPVYG